MKSRWVKSALLKEPYSETSTEATPSSGRERLSIAVIIPCFNEELSVGEVVQEFRARLPEATVYVYDNNSSDRTCEVATQAGAIVRKEFMQGKGNVVRRMFADVEADIYVMADGDYTYDAARAPRMVDQLIEENLDMVVGTRLESKGDSLFRLGHRFGNIALTWFVGRLFGSQFRDILSGYRVFSRRFVKSFPALSSGFEVETELTIHALELRMPVAEIDTNYSARPEGSASKLKTFQDGFRILGAILFLLKELRPLYFFGILSVLLATIAISLAYPLFWTFIETGLVPRLPTAVLSTGLMILAFLSLACGIVLDNVGTQRWETKRMTYLSIPGTLARSLEETGTLTKNDE
jgi:glycosyltransferase involved in cell wall biosynthesis